jgi:serine/threonine-protein kinase
MVEAIGRYRVVRELGRGGMGVVYEAEDPVLGRKVALKTIHRGLIADPAAGKMFEERFFAEARAAAGLSHPGIVVVHDVGRDEWGRLFIALEFLTGQTLDRQLAAAGALPWEEALRLAAGVADALRHAHARGIIHRDVKPANVMILDSGEPKILDFGIARLPESDLTSRAGVAPGSPAYMAPERMDGRPPDPRSDIFSLGAVLYEMVTGRRAFDGKDFREVVRRVQLEHPEPPSRLRPELPASVDGIVARAMAKDPAERYPTAQAFGDDLTAAAAGWPVEAAVPVAPEASPAAATPSVPAAGAPPALGASVSGGTVRAGATPGLALPAGKRVSLAILEGSRQGETFALSKPRIVIGRAAGGVGADVEIDDPEASRGHAAVECFGSRVVVRDLQSTNGTFVGEGRVEQAELTSHDEFRIGRTRFMLIVTDPD